MATTPTDLDALKALLDNAATSTPWEVTKLHTTDTKFVITGGEDAYAVGTVWDRADADLIAALRNQAPALLALASTCSCATTYATYEGPEADCPVHGAVRALAEVTRERDAAREEAKKARDERAQVVYRLTALRFQRDGLLAWAAGYLGNSLIHKRIREHFGLPVDAAAMSSPEVHGMATPTAAGEPTTGGDA